MLFCIKSLCAFIDNARNESRNNTAFASFFVTNFFSSYHIDVDAEDRGRVCSKALKRLFRKVSDVKAGGHSVEMTPRHGLGLPQLEDRGTIGNRERTHLGSGF